MDIDGEKSHQAATAGAGVNRRIHHGVVQMLSLNRRMIAQEHVTVLQALATIDGKAIAHRHADRIGNEDRHAAGALGDQLTIRAYQPNGEIFILVYVRAEGRARDVRVNLIGDRNDAMTDDFEGDGIGGRPRHCELWACFHESTANENINDESWKRKQIQSSCINFLFIIHLLSLILILISCSSPISKLSPGQTSVVEPYSSMTAGPVPLKPGSKASRL